MAQTFNILNARDLIEKLGRELNRMSDGSLEDRTDAAFNFAVTAWSTMDWLYRDIRKLADLGKPIPADLDESARAISSNVLKKKFAGPRDKHGGILPELKFCQVIANASKHGSKQETTPTVDVTVSARSTLTMSEWEPLADLVSMGTGKMVTLKIIIDGVSQRAVPLFREIEQKLREFIDENGL